MSSDDLIRTWKDPEYRGDADLDGHPAGEITLGVGGGVDTLPTEFCTQTGCTWDCTIFNCSADVCTLTPNCPVSIIY
jgi:hypothetical protein